MNEKNMRNQVDTIFYCANCDAQFPKWSGRCLECGKWDTIEETASASAKEQKQNLENEKALLMNAPPIADFNSITVAHGDRIPTGLNEFDRVLGGGLVKGSLILLGGDPGIGKSTLSLQIASLIAQTSGDTSFSLYVSGEESGGQIKTRLDRIFKSSPRLYFLGETSVEAVIGAIIKHKPIFTVVDSIQTMRSSDVESEAGSVIQIRACAIKFLECAKKYGVPILITGHVTKEGFVAGPKMLEHLVDVVMYLEGDGEHFYKLLRCVKNRFGALHEIGVFEMRNSGLLPIANPSELFLEKESAGAPGASVAVVMEGIRPLLIEIQALTAKTHFGYPKRTVAGFDMNRLQLLIAILNKRAGVNLSMHDVYVNVVGGYKIKDTSADLAVAAALISARNEVPLEKKVFIGEVGLGGEIRRVPHIAHRVKEARHLGFSTVFLPKQLLGEVTAEDGTEIIAVKSVNDLEQYIKK